VSLSRRGAEQVAVLVEEVDSWRYSGRSKCSIDTTEFTRSAMRLETNTSIAVDQPEPDVGVEHRRQPEDGDQHAAQDDADGDAARRRGPTAASMKTLNPSGNVAWARPFNDVSTSVAHISRGRP